MASQIWNWAAEYNYGTLFPGKYLIRELYKKGLPNCFFDK